MAPEKLEQRIAELEKQNEQLGVKLAETAMELVQEKLVADRARESWEPMACGHAEKYLVHAIPGSAHCMVCQLAAAESRASRAETELSRFLALEKHLPKGYAIGDDATAELAVELARAEQATKEAEESRDKYDADAERWHEMYLDCHADWRRMKDKADAAESRLSVERERVTELEAVLRNIAENYDHDEDAHKYGTQCRCCIAERALSVKPEGTTPPQKEKQQ